VQCVGGCTQRQRASIHPYTGSLLMRCRNDRDTLAGRRAGRAGGDSIVSWWSLHRIVHSDGKTQAADAAAAAAAVAMLLAGADLRKLWSMPGRVRRVGVESRRKRGTTQPLTGPAQWQPKVVKFGVKLISVIIICYVCSVRLLRLVIPLCVCIVCSCLHFLITSALLLVCIYYHSWRIKDEY